MPEILVHLSHLGFLYCLSPVGRSAHVSRAVRSPKRIHGISRQKSGHRSPLKTVTQGQNYMKKLQGGIGA